MSEDKFDEEKFMRALVKLKDTQESIQGFSSWVIKNRKQSYKMSRCWTKVIKKVKSDQKLVLFYLVNDVVQHSSKKGVTDIVDKFRGAIKDALPHLKEERIANKVQRCLNIWNEREVFDSEYIQELSELIDMTPAKEDSEIIENFQSNELCKQIKIMKALEDDADYKLKTLKENDLENKDLEMMKAKLKDKSSGYNHVGQFREATKRMEAYMKAMQREVDKRKQVIELLCQGRKYYDSLYGEAEIVATAYANFGSRVQNVESRLNDKIPIFLSTPSAPSPLPSPDYDAPSPQGEADLKLPEDDEPGTPDYPAPSHTPPGPPPSSRVISHTPSSTPPPPPEEHYNRHTPPPSHQTGYGQRYTPPHSSGRGYSPPPPPTSLSTRRESFTPPPPPSLSGGGSNNTDLTARLSSIPGFTSSNFDDPTSSFFHHSQENTRDLTREAMNIPRDSVNDFLTKIAHGEVIGSHDTVFNISSGESDSKRRKLSGSGSFSGNNGDTGYGGSSSGSLYGSQPVWPARNDYQTEEDNDVVENQALERLRRAANKNQGSSNLISLTGSPAIRDPGGANDIDGNPMGDDMEMSEEEEGEIFDEKTNPWSQNPFESTTNPADSMLYTRSQPPPTRSQPPPSLLSGSGFINGTSENIGIPTFISNTQHQQPPPNLNMPPVTGAPALPVLDIPPPPFRVPPPIDKSLEESGVPWPPAGGLPPSVMEAITTPNTSFNIPPPLSTTPTESTNISSFNTPPPTTTAAFSAPPKAGAFSGPPPNIMSRPPPPLSPTPAVSAPTTPQANAPAPGFRSPRRFSNDSMTSLDSYAQERPKFDNAPPMATIAASFIDEKNNINIGNGGNEDYADEYIELDEHLNNMRSGDPEAVETKPTNYAGGGKSEFNSGGNGQTPVRSPFGGGGGGIRGRGGFTPESGGFKTDHNRGGGFGNRGTPRGGSPFRGGGGFDRGGGGFDRGGGRGSWNGDRGSSGWRPRRPWGGPTNGRGRGNW